jgi:acyl-CoA reductase-like NAD-dependent aldehyde dehydrogenase
MLRAILRNEVFGQHLTTSPVNGQPIAEFPRSTAEDIDKALDAAHAAADDEESQ